MHYTKDEQRTLEMACSVLSPKELKELQEYDQIIQQLEDKTQADGSAVDDQERILKRMKMNYVMRLIESRQSFSKKAEDALQQVAASYNQLNQHIHSSSRWKKPGTYTLYVCMDEITKRMQIRIHRLSGPTKVTNQIDVHQCGIHERMSYLETIEVDHSSEILYMSACTHQEHWGADSIKMI